MRLGEWCCELLWRDEFKQLVAVDAKLASLRVEFVDHEEIRKLIDRRYPGITLRSMTPVARRVVSRFPSMNAFAL
jgi:hypothetical protein